MKITACLFILLLSAAFVRGQDIPYGNNPKTGKYVTSGDAKIYYEIYGEGPPLLLLHGGYYGYISEYSQYYPDLSKHFKVIAVATRGHGKSEIGHQRMTYALFAQDALAVLKKEGIEKTAVMGFSDGAITGNILAAEFPAIVTKLVSMGGPLNATMYRPEAYEQTWRTQGKTEEQNLPDFLKERKKIMPEPQRFSEWVDMLREAWMEPVWVSNEKASRIACPVLIVAGDRDDYTRTDAFVSMLQIIPTARLLVLPNSGHVSLILNPEMLRDFIIPFLEEKK
ncbi:alpha/beta fold hydrolase [Chryseolinea lacunae]|uniref:Alpha/beta hydrolase n=1 Tax=Chryseolinea lacunae TaxID=2801331 RepID=A0ABS1KUK8_9BACT|nr:alpha/beta hydrolase [Chryseolinea lacunae]MBL0743159.1 alpha/beta hydrolase [Chryseolinea lacunae]